MFTGIVEAVGRIDSVREGGEGRTVRIHAPEVTTDLEPGSSIAVDGACLTVLGVEEDQFEVHVIDSTLSRTIAGGYAPESRVNLELATPLGKRLDGHLVQGHVDGLGTLVRRTPMGESWLLDLAVPPIVEEVTIVHGSIAVNGVSLTVNALPGAGECQVAIIPYTWQHTNLAELTPGDRVNLEGDLIGKYVGRMLAARMGWSSAPRGDTEQGPQVDSSDDPVDPVG